MTAERNAITRNRVACRSGRRLRARRRSSSLRSSALGARGRTAWRFRAEAMGGTIADPAETFHKPGSVTATSLRKRMDGRGRNPFV